MIIVCCLLLLLKPTQPSFVSMVESAMFVSMSVAGGAFFFVPCFSVVSLDAFGVPHLAVHLCPSPLQGYWSETADARDERLAEEETSQETRKERWELQALWKVYGRLEGVGAGIGGDLPCRRSWISARSSRRPLSKRWPRSLRSLPPPPIIHSVL